MPSLDNPDDIKTIDPENVLGSIVGLKDQLTHAWDDAQKVEIPQSYQNINKVVMCGMGGSGLGARFIESVYGPSFQYPLIRVNDYHLPPWVDEHTLVFCSSYSGTTEETVQNLKEALEKKAQILVIATGGTLRELAEENQLPLYVINPIFNPSKQPRLAIGYSVIGQLVLAQKVGLITLTRQEIDALVIALEDEVAHLNASLPTGQNLAKQWAEALKDKITIFITARHLVGAVHTVKNQRNENSKQLAVQFEIPELNHHFMEGLQFPQANAQNLVFIFTQSPLYENRIKQRFEITQDVVRQHQISTLVWQSNAQNPLEDAFRFIQFGAFTNFYINVLTGTNPAPIPWVDYFKTKLGQPLGK